ncbi:MAG: YfiT family bacillithiol transferase [Crocinitomicaceae bacterium]
MQDIEELKFPIGKYEPNKNPDSETLNSWINQIKTFPDQLSKTLAGVDETKLRWCYRPKGWNTIQLVHHCADSHMNAFIRFKLALTEDSPIIKPYDEALWSKLPDSSYENLPLSVGLLTHLHAKWVSLFNAFSMSDLTKTYIHPEHGQVFNLAETIGNYAWHGRHHLAHINLAFDSRGKFND